MPRGMPISLYTHTQIYVDLYRSVLSVNTSQPTSQPFCYYLPEPHFGTQKAPIPAQGGKWKEVLRAGWTIDPLVWSICIQNHLN
jgi:hypothetical protein